MKTYNFKNCAKFVIILDNALKVSNNLIFRRKCLQLRNQIFNFRSVPFLYGETFHAFAFFSNATIPKELVAQMRNDGLWFFTTQGAVGSARASMMNDRFYFWKYVIIGYVLNFIYPIPIVMRYFDASPRGIDYHGYFLGLCNGH